MTQHQLSGKQRPRRRRRRERNSTWSFIYWISFNCSWKSKKSRNVFFFFFAGCLVPGHLPGTWNVHQKLLAKLLPADKAHKLSFPFILRFFFLGKCENLLRQVQNNDMQSNLRTPGHGGRVSDAPQEVAHSSLCVMDSKCPSLWRAGRA